MVNFSFVDPFISVAAPVNELFGLEPEGNFLVGGFDRVRSVTNIATDIDAEVTSDGSWVRVEWLGSTEHFSSCENYVGSFPNHAANWCRSSPSRESWEERSSSKI